MEQRKLYIADLHLFHINVTKSGKDFDDRPYKTLGEMHTDILKRWNESVTKADHVYILGDIVWKMNQTNQKEVMELLNRMNGNFHLIIGNHDRITSSVFKKRFDEIVPYKEIEDTVYGKIRSVVLSHYYIPFYNGHYHKAILLHGHSHVTKEALMEQNMTKYFNDNGFPAEIYNVGCMYPYMDYAPKTLEQIVDGYAAWEGKEEWINSKVERKI